MNIRSAAIEYIAPERMLTPELELSPGEAAPIEEINRKVAAGESLDAVLNYFYDASAALYPGDRMGVAFLEEDGARVVSRWARADYAPVLLDEGFSQDMQGSSLDALMQGNALRIINDLEAYLEEHPDSASTKLLVREGVRSSLTCPIAVEGRRIGFIFRSARQANAYTIRHAQLHVLVTERLSQAIEKAWRIYQLEEASRSYFEVLSFVSHELKSPLASIVMDANGLQSGLWGRLDPKPHEKVGKMAAKALYLIDLVQEYLNLARVESGGMQPEFRETNFAEEVARPALDMVLTQFEAKRMQLEQRWPDAPIRIACDAGLMKIVLVNLFSNAAKYGNEEGIVRVSAEISGDCLRVTVFNEGPGFPASARGRLFRKFSRIQTPELLKQKGTGVGLYTTWRIVRAHGGKISARSEEGQWAEFTVVLPLRQPRDLSAREKGPEHGNGNGRNGGKH